MKELPLPYDGVYYIIVRTLTGGITLAQAQEFDVDDYKVASRHYWHEYELKEAVSYARDLAKKHGLEYKPYHDELNLYLD